MGYGFNHYHYMHLCHRNRGSLFHGRVIVVRGSETLQEIEILLNVELDLYKSQKTILLSLLEPFLQDALF